jgi:VanZ family protein
MSVLMTMLRWLPALVVMMLIFGASSLPASRIPYLGEIDVLVKKFGHAFGYALLALAYYIALPTRLSRGYRAFTAWFMAFLFALSDEYHQSFIEGRTSSMQDVVIDSMGAVIALIVGVAYSSNSKSISSS